MAPLVAALHNSGSSQEPAHGGAPGGLDPADTVQLSQGPSGHVISTSNHPSVKVRMVGGQIGYQPDSYEAMMQMQGGNVGQQQA